MKKLALFFGITLLLLVGSCKEKDTKKEIQILPPQEFHDATAGNDVQLLDVRTADEFEEGHLDDAINIDVLKEDFSEKAESLDKDKPLYLYCRSGNRSAKASSILKDMGFNEIYDMEGGYLLWSSENIDSQN